jgi:catechol 2,3-dioxygenase-like lactoylglutathione lyase family enzyme
MTGEQIDHIAFLVPDLEAAQRRWADALGYHFSPIVRYRTNRYSDHSDPEPHFHDVRLSLSREGEPHIELMEVSGSGTHGPAELGIHHLGIRVADVTQRIVECADLGMASDGMCTREDGSVSIWFTRKEDLDGVRLEFISPIPGPLVADDGSPLWVDPATGRKNVWGPPSTGLD